MATVEGGYRTQQDHPLRRPTTHVSALERPVASHHPPSIPFAKPIGEVSSEDFPDAGMRRRSPDQHRSSPDSAPIYGELIVLGTNGSLPCPGISPKMSNRYIFRKQPKATGVSPIDRDVHDMDPLNRKSTHTISMTAAKSSKHTVTEYGHDTSSDLFQIGRSSDSAIDFVVVETVTLPDDKKMYKSNSTVSRYACRIQCERRPPYTARLFAAAFDTKGRIQLSAMAPTWQMPSGECDGLTTNGVAFMRPSGTFESGVNPGDWREATVMGNVRRLREQRSSRLPGQQLPEETNILTDGCLIDLCGVTLMWRTAIGLEQGPSDTMLRSHRQVLNDSAWHCPVNFFTLQFRSKSTQPGVPTDLDAAREPWVYLNCGHVYSYHEWKARPQETNSKRTCPLCREASGYVRLELGQERAFFIDGGELTHAFNPCGHVTTERTTQYWTSVQIPHLASEWSPRCPFCSGALDSKKPTVRLLFS